MASLSLVCGSLRNGLSVGVRALARQLEGPPRLRVVLPLAFVLCTAIFVRSPATNFIFDEQEALLANPYVNGDQLGIGDAFKRDFWGLPPERTIGSYRPMPNLIWRGLFKLQKVAWWPHFTNVVFHAANASLLVVFAFLVTRRRALAWLAGAIFLLAAVLTEAISGVVGLADVLSGFGVLLALLALKLPPWQAFLGIFFAISVGLFSKESTIVAVPLVSMAALFLAPTLFPLAPRRALRALVALSASALAVVAYTYLRRRWFPVPLPLDLKEPLAATAPMYERVFHEFLRWFHQPQLSKDPINNPLAHTEFPLRVAGALRVYFRGLLQVVAPWTLSADYSYPQEPVPEEPVFVQSVLGAAALLGPPVAGVVLWFKALFREREVRLVMPCPVLGAAGAENRTRAAHQSPAAFHPHGVPDVSTDSGTAHKEIDPKRSQVAAAEARETESFSEGDAERGGARAAEVSRNEGLAGASEQEEAIKAALVRRVGPLLLLAVGLVWFPVAYFPHSNIPVLLPTVRAERFWYLPAIGTSLVLAYGFSWLLAHRRPHRDALAAIALFLAFQAIQARRHALDYTNDLVFWEATRDAVPLSAKAHLNYSVMLGARGRQEERLEVNERAVTLAPAWAMAHVYYGDALCRLRRTDEAWPSFLRGFELAPGDPNLIALALQCMWSEKALTPQRQNELGALAARHPGTWLAYLANDIRLNGTKHDGVDPKYRPRGYGEGPKKP